MFMHNLAVTRRCSADGCGVAALILRVAFKLGHGHDGTRCIPHALLLTLLHYAASIRLRHGARAVICGTAWYSAV